MSRGLGELQVIALVAFAEHNRKHAADERCWHCTADGFLSASTLRELAWPALCEHLEEQPLRNFRRCGR